MAKTQIKTNDIADAAVNGAKLGVLSAKGDVLVHNGTTHTRLPVGTDGQVLVSDSTAGSGVAWAAGVTAANLVNSEAPAGTINGVNTAFTLANTPVAGTVHLYKNGIRQRAGAGNDYTIASGTITFETGNEPQTGDILLADYRK